MISVFASTSESMSASITPHLIFPLESNIDKKEEPVFDIISTLDKLIAARTSLGYDYIVYGLLLINEDQTRVSNITKALYIDIAAHYETSWSCVETDGIQDKD